MFSERLLIMSNSISNDYDARIVIDVKDDSFIVSHTTNIDSDQLYVILLAAIEYMDENDISSPRTLN